MKNDETIESTVSIPDLAPATPLKKFVWYARRTMRDISGKDRLKDASIRQDAQYRVYKIADEFMSKFFPGLASVPSRKIAMARVRDMIAEEGYEIVESDETKPWGAYYRISNDQADQFIASLFPGLSPEEARLGRDDVEISPKFLLVLPNSRLSWQYHHRRAERWRFLTKGGYAGSKTDEQSDVVYVEPDTIVQFDASERHRLCSLEDSYALVAEIWQHVDPGTPSSEDDIIRLQDDYKR